MRLFGFQITRVRKTPYRPAKLKSNTEAQQLSEAELESFYDAAGERPWEEMFRAMDALMTELALTHPRKVAKLRIGIIWLRQHAKLRDLPWGGN